MDRIGRVSDYDINSEEVSDRPLKVPKINHGGILNWLEMDKS